MPPFLPDNKDHGWAPYLWALYFGFFYLDPVLSHAGWQKWVATAVATVVFLILYFGFFWARASHRILYIAAFVAMGLVYAPWHTGAATFFIYAACLIPFAVNSTRKSAALLICLFAVVSLECWLLHAPFWQWFYSSVFAVVLGTGNVFFAERDRANDRLRMANDEIEHLAKVAERERIARDLHDILGHTLSLIILKSELAGKLVERDPQRAKSEIGDVERTAREALAEVRSTIRGYRSQSLDSELKAAMAALETAGVQVNSDAGSVPLTPAQESVVAMVIREAITNVVRHSHARTCSLRMAPIDGNCLLEIQDDGQGGAYVEGNGLRGMRERIEALGGTIQRESDSGTRLTIQFPLTPVKANGSK